MHHPQMICVQSCIIGIGPSYPLARYSHTDWLESTRPYAATVPHESVRSVKLGLRAVWPLISMWYGFAGGGCPMRPQRPFRLQSSTGADIVGGCWELCVSFTAGLLRRIAADKFVAASTSIRRWASSALHIM